MWNIYNELSWLFVNSNAGSEVIYSCQEQTVSGFFQMQRDHTSLTGVQGSNASSPTKKYLTTHTPEDRKLPDTKGKHDW